MASQELLVRRIFSFIFDYFCIMFSWIAINTGLTRFYLSLSNHFNFAPSFTFEDHFIVFSLVSIFPICFIGYFTANYYLSRGSTLGKTLMGIRYECNREHQLNSCLTRAILQFFSFLMVSIPNLTSFFSSDNRSMIDMFMKNTHLPITLTIDLTTDEIDNVLEFPNYEWDFDSEEKEAA